MITKKKIDISAGKGDSPEKMKKLFTFLGDCKIMAVDVKFNCNDPPDFIKLKPMLYKIINTFEKKTSIIFFDMPYCIIPDAEEHVINPPSDNKTKYAVCGKCKFDSFCGGFPKLSKLKPGDKFRLKPQQ